MFSKDLYSFKANTKRKPSPVRIYWSRIALKMAYFKLHIPNVFLKVKESHSPVLLLTGSIENVQEARLTIDQDLLSVAILNLKTIFFKQALKIRVHRRVVFFDKLILNELNCECRLA